MWAMCSWPLCKRRSMLQLLLFSLISVFSSPEFHSLSGNILRGVYSDTPQLNSTSRWVQLSSVEFSWVELRRRALRPELSSVEFNWVVLCRYKRAFSQALCSTLFTRSQPFNEMFIFNDKSHCCDSTGTDVQFTLLLVNNVWQTNYFRRIESTLSPLHLLKFSFKFVNFSRSNVRKQRGFVHMVYIKQIN